MTSAQWRVFGLAAIVVAASRLLALARSLWEWDEALFCLGLRDFDITQHHPHPPGFPVFIAAARVLRLVVDSEFRSLQTLAVGAGMLLFPAVFFYARELGLRFETSLVAALLCAFFPNVWFFGGTAFSDVPSVTVALFAVTLLLRGMRSRAAFFGGTVLLALAAGIRPQNLLIGLFPGVMAMGRRSWRDIALALIIGTLIVGAAFGGAMYATGSYESYMSAIEWHKDYIARQDSFLSPERPPLWRLIDRFFLKQYQSPPLSAITSIFVLIGAVGAIRSRDRSILWNVLTFAPFAIMAWLMLDRFSVSRFAIGYIPMFAVLAADGIRRCARERPRVELAIGGVLVIAFIAWTAPGLTPVRREIAPTVQAVNAMSAVFDPQRDDLYVGFAMVPFVEVLRPDIRFIRVWDDRAIPLSVDPGRRSYLLAEASGDIERPGLFRRERGRLWNISRRHYFEVLFEPLRSAPVFLSGWHPAERTTMDESRSTTGRAVVQLPPADRQNVLRVEFNVPAELVARSARVSIVLNGKPIDQFTATTEHNVREHHVLPAPAGQPNILELSVDPATTEVTAEGSRESGLRVRYLSFGPP